MSNKRSAVVQFDIFGDNFRVTIAEDRIERFRKPIADGDWGGHQRFIARMQAREKLRTLDMTGEELADAYRKAFAYGDGSWQEYSRILVEAGERAGWKPSPELRAEIGRLDN